MNFKNIIATCILSILVGVSAGIKAQFQGKIEMKAYTDDNGTTEENTFNMFVTEDRIMIQGDDISFGGGVSAQGLLIRNDNKDFVVLMGENQAMQVTKVEIEGLIEMFASWGGPSTVKKDLENTAPNYRFSDETRTILGKECAELIIDDEEDPDNYLSVWLTPNIDINWGMLAEPWKNIPENMEREVNGMSQELLFQGKNFPLLIEAHEGDSTKKVFEVTNMEESNIAKAMVQVPSGITLISAKEFIFNMMMQQQ